MPDLLEARVLEIRPCVDHHRRLIQQSVPRPFSDRTRQDDTGGGSLLHLEEHRPHSCLDRFEERVQAHGAGAVVGNLELLEPEVNFMQ